MAVMERAHWPEPVGRPVKPCDDIVADQGYVRDTFWRYGDRDRMKPMIARRTMHRRLCRCRRRGFDQAPD